MILIAFGTRPEWIKIYPVIKKLQTSSIKYRLLCTGQHGSLIDDTVKEFDVEYLSITSGNNRLDDIVQSVLRNSDSIFNNILYVMVQGDTTSAFAIALGAFHRNIKVIHLEAGLRSWNKNHPYPEEFNRIAIGALTDIHLCPTERAKNNLIKVASRDSKIYVVGNTVLDNLLDLEPVLDNIVLVTLHRRENIKIMNRWFKAINELAIQYPNLQFIFPMHPNPSIQKYKHLLTNVIVLEPLSYTKCLDYLRRSSLVITDSGGLQEESSFLKKKCIVCRDTTERSEGEGIFSWLCHDPNHLNYLFTNIKLEHVDAPCPYGDGKSSNRIVDILESYNVY